MFITFPRQRHSRMMLAGRPLLQVGELCLNCAHAPAAGRHKEIRSGWKSPWGRQVSIIHPLCTDPETSPSWKCSRRQTWTEETPLRRCCHRCWRPRCLQLCPAAGGKPVKLKRISAPSSSHLAHLQRDPVVFSRYESVDVIVPELLHHGRQLSVTLDHNGAAPAALLVLQ